MPQSNYRSHDPQAIQRMMQEQLERQLARQQESLQSQYITTYNINSITETEGTLARPAVEPRPSILWQSREGYNVFSPAPRTSTQMLKEEVKLVEQFITTGSPPDRIHLYLDKKTLYVKGTMTAYGDILFTVNRTTIKTPPVRGKKLVKILTALAEREGLELEITPITAKAISTRLAYWPWSNIEVDDSGLITAQPREEPDERGVPDRIDLEGVPF